MHNALTFRLFIRNNNLKILYDHLFICNLKINVLLALNTSQLFDNMLGPLWNIFTNKCSLYTFYSCYFFLWWNLIIVTITLWCLTLLTNSANNQNLQGRRRYMEVGTYSCYLININKSLSQNPIYNRIIFIYRKIEH